MPHRRLDRHLGTRGWILLLCAQIWGLVGLGVVLRAATEGDPALLHLYVPAAARVAGWWAGAVLAIHSAISRRGMPLTVFVLILMPLIRVTSYAWGWLTWLLHQVPWLAWLAPDVGGVQDGWYAVAIHTALVGLVLIAAHTRDPRDGVQ